MINNFANCLAFTLKQEGGFSDDKNDPGGATMKGITLATYRQYVKRNATKSDLKKISDANVEMIYRDEYWMRVHGPEIPVGLDLGVFDFAVHSGVERAIIGLQLAVGTPEDGSFGRRHSRLCRVRMRRRL